MLVQRVGCACGTSSGNVSRMSKLMNEHHELCRALGALVLNSAQRERSKPAGAGWLHGTDKPAGLCGAVFAGEATQEAHAGARRPVHTLHFRQNTHLASSESVDCERRVRTPKPVAVNAELSGGV